MSQLTVTTIKTENSSTPLTLTTGNASGAIVTVQANSDVRIAGTLRVANETIVSANLNFDDTLSTKITDPGANVMSFHTTQTERMRLDNTGNVLVGRTDSTVGQRVRLDVAGAVNASAVLVNGTELAAGVSTGKAIAMVIVFG